MKHEKKKATKSNATLLHELYVAHAHHIDGQYHNMLWQIMMNSSCQGAFVHRVIDDSIVVAQADGGYIPAMIKIIPSKRDEILADLNKQIFGLDDDQVHAIEMASFREGS